jgi:tetratricopeptide (TPR) repeat protein
MDSTQAEGDTSGAFAAGAVRGAVEMAFAATLLVPLASVFSRNPDTDQLVASWIGLVLGGTIYGCGPPLWARARTKLGKRLALLLTGLLSVLALTLAVQVGSSRAMRDVSQEGMLLALGAAVAIALGVGQALAGVPFGKIDWSEGGFSLREPGPRGVALTTYGSIVALVPFFVIFFGLLGAHAEKLFEVSALVVYGFPILTFLRALLAPVAERATRKAFEKKKAPSTRDDAIATWRTSLSLAATAVDPDARKKFLESALEGARVAYAFSLAEQPFPELSEDRRRYLELIFLLGRTDEIETALARFCEGPVLEAELARLRGEPQRAIELARGALDSSDASATDKANAQSVLALAEAELGRFDEARARLEAIQRAQKIVRPFVPRFSASSVEVEIARLEAALKEPAAAESRKRNARRSGERQASPGG